MQTNFILGARVVLLIVRWSDQEHLFVHKEDKVSRILRELLKQKLIALHASSAVRICQLLCTVPFERFQTQVLTNNPGHRRSMNTRLPWYLTDSPVGLRLSSWLKTKSSTVSTFPSVRALLGLPLPGRLSTACACDPQFFQQLINTTLWSAVLRKFVYKPLCCVVCTPANANFLSKSCPRRWKPCWLLTNAAVTSQCCDEFPMPQIDRKRK